MKIKKLLSLISAAAISASCFVGMTVTASAEYASAADVDLTFAGGYGPKSNTTISVPNTDGSITINNLADAADIGGGINDNSSNSVAYTDTSNPDMKALFDADNDGNIDSQYTYAYFNYIGKSGNYNATVSVSVPALPTGTYNVYLVGNRTGISSAELGNYALGSTGSVTIGSNIVVNEYTINLSETFAGGNITFANKNGWLPDLYAIRVVGSNYKTQADVITGADIVRPAGRATYFDTYTSKTSTEEGKVTELFGADFGKAGNIALSYTDSVDDFFYMNITEEADYNVYILGSTSRNTIVTFTKLADNSVQNATTNSNKKVGSAEKTNGNTDTIYLFEADQKLSLTEGVYKVTLNKVENYYTNFIALALDKVPQPVETTLTAAAAGETYTDADGKAAASFKTAAVSLNGELTKAVWTVTATNAEGKTATAAVTNTNENTTVVTDADIVFAILISDITDGVTIDSASLSYTVVE